MLRTVYRERVSGGRSSRSYRAVGEVMVLGALGALATKSKHGDFPSPLRSNFHPKLGKYLDDLDARS